MNSINFSVEIQAASLPMKQSCSKTLVENCQVKLK